MKPPCPGFDDLTDAKTKEVGGTQSFWHYLDTDPTLSAYARDVVLELWMPKSERLGTDRRRRDYAASNNSALCQSCNHLLDCAGQVRAPACTLATVRVHVADLRDLKDEEDDNEENKRDLLFEAVCSPKLRGRFMAR
jgi:hypothetical protein